MFYHMKRTTLILNENLVTQLRKLAAEQGTTMTRLVQSFIRNGLYSVRRSVSKYHFDPPVVCGKHPPVVDPANRKMLYDVMDGLS